MTAYLLMITPEGAGTQGLGQAAIRVETSPVPRITEITITATAATGLSAAALPAVDLEGVIRALTAGAPVAEKPAADEPAPGAPARKTARQATRKARKSATPARKTDRPYRQMPEAAELRSVFEDIGSVTGVAAHYNVPRYTAQGWISRLRRSAG